MEKEKMIKTLKKDFSSIGGRFKKIERISDKIEDCVDFISFGIYAGEMGKPIFFLVNPNKSQVGGENKKKD
jgi:hypothetical protein